MAKPNYSNWDKKDLIKEVEALKKKKTYGLVWEEDKTKEAFDYYLNWDGTQNKETFGEEEGKFPVLQEVKNKSIDNKDPKYNFMIEGDNYHALAVLNFTHNKSIDVIYIDPPYNTGNNDFVYNDKMIDKEDGFRHSKWLSFMSKRLKLAKDLLKKEGVMFISIDDNEVAQLLILCEEIFDRGNTDLMIWDKITGNTNAGTGKMKITHRFRKDHEYLVVVYKNKNKTFFNKPLRIKNFKNDYGNPDNDPRGNWMSCEICKSEEKSNPNGKNYYDIKTTQGKIIKRQWHFSKKEFLELDKDNRIYWGKGNIIPRLKNFLKEKSPTTPVSILQYIASTTDGNNEIKDLSLKFDNPKPTELIKYLLEISSKKDSIILDFFAGSGTTGHSVMKLNKLDGGKRKFILCTNNESNNGSGIKIATDVCYPRIKKVIEGYTDNKNKKVEGYKDNFKYFKTAFVESAPTDQNKKKIVDKSTEMLCIKENAFKPIIDKKGYKVFKNSDIHLGIIFDDEQIDKFVKEAKNIKGKFHVYVFSFDDSVPKEDFKSMEGRIKLCPIPEVILHVYRKIFK